MSAAHRRGLEDTLVPWRKSVKAALVQLDAADQPEPAVDAIRATAEESAEDTFIRDPEDLDEDDEPATQ